MNRLIFALALAPALIATGAHAQTVGDDVAKQLWCGEAWTVYYGGLTAATPDQQPALDALVKGSKSLLDKGSQGYLDAGYTEEALAKIKTDLIAEVTPVLSGQPGKYNQDDCTKALMPFVVMPPQPSAPADTSTAPDASSPMDASSASAQ